MEKQKPPKSSLRVSKPSVNIGSGRVWTITVFILSFALSVVFSGSTTAMLRELNITWAFILLLIIILLNIFFDMIATAAQTAEELPFHSLSSRRVSGAVQSVNLIRHAPQVSSLCADVIGDIAGIVSGGVTTIIAAELTSSYGMSGILPSLTLTGIVSSLTIGGKAFFKTIAMRNSNNIIYYLGKLIYYICFPFRKRAKGRK